LLVVRRWAKIIASVEPTAASHEAVPKARNPPRERKADDVTDGRLYLRGEIDLATVPALRAELARYVDDGVDLLVDCRHLTFLDSSGVAELVAARQALEARGHNMLLINVAGTPRRVLEVLNLTDWLSLERTSRPLDGTGQQTLTAS